MSQTDRQGRIIVQYLYEGRYMPSVPLYSADDTPRGAHSARCFARKYHLETGRPTVVRRMVAEQLALYAASESCKVSLAVA